MRRLRIGGEGGGITHVDFDAGNRDLERSLDAMAILAAGPLTAAYADPATGFDQRSDIDHQRELAEPFANSDEELSCLLALAQARARTLIRSQRFADGYEPLLAALLARGELSGAQLNELIERRSNGASQQQAA